MKENHILWQKYHSQTRELIDALPAVRKTVLTNENLWKPFQDVLHTANNDICVPLTFDVEVLAPLPDQPDDITVCWTRDYVHDTEINGVTIGLACEDQFFPLALLTDDNKVWSLQGELDNEDTKPVVTFEALHDVRLVADTYWGLQDSGIDVEHLPIASSEYHHFEPIILSSPSENSENSENSEDHEEETHTGVIDNGLSANSDDQCRRQATPDAGTDAHQDPQGVPQYFNNDYSISELSYRIREAFNIGYKEHDYYRQSIGYTSHWSAQHEFLQTHCPDMPVPDCAVEYSIDNAKHLLSGDFDEQCIHEISPVQQPHTHNGNDESADTDNTYHIDYDAYNTHADLPQYPRIDATLWESYAKYAYEDPTRQATIVQIGDLFTIDNCSFHIDEAHRKNLSREALAAILFLESYAFPTLMGLPLSLGTDDLYEEIDNRSPLVAIRNFLVGYRIKTHNPRAYISPYEHYLAHVFYEEIGYDDNEPFIAAETRNSDPLERVQNTDNLSFIFRSSASFSDKDAAKVRHITTCLNRCKYILDYCHTTQELVYYGYATYRNTPTLNNMSLGYLSKLESAVLSLPAASIQEHMRMPELQNMEEGLLNRKMLASEDPNELFPVLRVYDPVHHPYYEVLHDCKHRVSAEVLTEEEGGQLRLALAQFYGTLNFVVPNGLDFHCNFDKKNLALDVVLVLHNIVHPWYYDDEDQQWHRRGSDEINEIKQKFVENVAMYLGTVTFAVTQHSIEQIAVRVSLQYGTSAVETDESKRTSHDTLPKRKTKHYPLSFTERLRQKFSDQDNEILSVREETSQRLEQEAYEEEKRRRAHREQGNLDAALQAESEESAYNKHNDEEQQSSASAIANSDKSVGLPAQHNGYQSPEYDGSGDPENEQGNNSLDNGDAENGNADNGGDADSKEDVDIHAAMREFLKSLAQEHHDHHHDNENNDELSDGADGDLYEGTDAIADSDTDSLFDESIFADLEVTREDIIAQDSFREDVVLEMMFSQEFAESFLLSSADDIHEGFVSQKALSVNEHHCFIPRRPNPIFDKYHMRYVSSPTRRYRIRHYTKPFSEKLARLTGAKSMLDCAISRGDIVEYYELQLQSIARSKSMDRAEKARKIADFITKTQEPELLMQITKITTAVINGSEDIVVDFPMTERLIDMVQRAVITMHSNPNGLPELLNEIRTLVEEADALYYSTEAKPRMFFDYGDRINYNLYHKTKNEKILIVPKPLFELHQILADTSMMTGNDEDVLEHYNRMVSYAQTSWYQHKQLAEYYMRNHNFDLAAAAWANALTSVGNRFQALHTYFNYGYCLDQEDNILPAIAMLMIGQACTNDDTSEVSHALEAIRRRARKNYLPVPATIADARAIINAMNVIDWTSVTFFDDFADITVEAIEGGYYDIAQDVYERMYRVEAGNLSISDHLFLESLKDRRAE